ncbi:MAG: TerC/Alx family metal homeostasis membrane protein [Chitinophagaceae bacterium]|nr:TerC/Alx family metal homeostasis membrane protein [Chitinophagaceae bacterium]
MENKTEFFLYVVFGFIIILSLVIDLGFIHKQSSSIKQKEATIQSLIWVLLSGCFGLFIYFWYDPNGDTDSLTSTIEYYSAYLTEYALSMDNIFIILLIVRYFKIKDIYLHKVLFWGILGAVFFRGIFIFVGAYVIHEFHYVLYLFALILMYSGVKLMKEDTGAEKEFDGERNFILRMCKKYLHFSESDGDGNFFIRKKNKIYFTTLFLAIILVETTDIVFAVDSIPAAFGISEDEFIIYTSNIFAVLGLRSMFFLLSNIIDKFHLLSKALAVILILVGTKMLIHDIVLIDRWHLESRFIAIVSFSVIISLLLISIVLSILFPKKAIVEK